MNIVKRGEETGEVANAFLALRGMQRDAKLQGSDQERLSALAKEIGDSHRPDPCHHRGDLPPQDPAGGPSRDPILGDLAIGNLIPEPVAPFTLLP